MFKIVAAIRKEVLMLLSDKVGLALMFIMPIVLVFVITIVQDSAYKLVNENKISLLISNHDTGHQGELLVELMSGSGLFEISRDSAIGEDALKRELISQDKLTALYIPHDFSEKLREKALVVSRTMTAELGLGDSTEVAAELQLPTLKFFHDPVLQENYCQSITGIVSSFLGLLENSLMIETVYAEVGIEKSPDDLKDKILSNRVKIESIAASSSGQAVLPNSTQHNVPAWTLFAMFFMVTSLGSNIAKERINGSFHRLKTMPTSFMVVLTGKMFVYLVAAILQVIVIFSIGVFIFPVIDLPKLDIPPNVLPFVTVTLLSGLSAVSFALLIGSLTKTQEQANGLGAISIILFAALGGIWVPTFVMPPYLQVISTFSPLYWCLEGFYILFLKGGSWRELLPVIFVLSLFIMACQLITRIKLRMDKLI